MPSSRSTAAGRVDLRRAAVDHDQVAAAYANLRGRPVSGSIAGLSGVGRRRPQLAGGSAGACRYRANRRRSTSRDRATTSSVAPRDDEPAVLALAGQAVLEDDHAGHHVGALDLRHVVALDPQRGRRQAERLGDLLQRLAARGEVAGPAQLVLGQRLRRRCGRRSPSAPSCRRAAGPAGAPGCRAARTATRPARRRRRAAPAPATRAGTSRPPRSPPYTWVQNGRPGRRWSASSVFSTTQPRWPRTRPPRTWKTCTAASSSSSAKATTSASVPSASTTACFSIARRSAARSSRSRAARSNSSCLDAASHLALQPALHRVGPAGHEVAEVLDDAPVLLGGRPGRRTAPSTCRCSPAGTAGRSGRAA